MRSFYRPPNASLDSDSPRIILAGDLDHPDIDWEVGLWHINPSPVYGYELNSLFVEAMHDNGFEQLVNLPTRGTIYWIW